MLRDGGQLGSDPGYSHIQGVQARQRDQFRPVGFAIDTSQAPRNTILDYRSDPVGLGQGEFGDRGKMTILPRSSGNGESSTPMVCPPRPQANGVAVGVLSTAPAVK